MTAEENHAERPAVITRQMFARMYVQFHDMKREGASFRARWKTIRKLFEDERFSAWPFPWWQKIFLTGVTYLIVSKAKMNLWE